MIYKLTLFISIIFIFSCGGKPDAATDSSGTYDANSDSQSYNVESAVSIVGGASGSAEGSVGLMSEDDYLSIHPQTTCSLSTARSSCASGLITVNWNSCTLGTTTLTGVWNEVYNDSSCSLSTIGNTLYRTTTTATITGLFGGNIKTDTSGGASYSGSTMGSTGILVSITGATSRTVSIDSIHRVFTTSGGQKGFDYFIKTGTPLSVTGSRATNNRTITSGSISLYHNLAKYTATHNFSNVVWGSSSCCYPTSGSITSSYSGSVTGSSTMTFTASCGVATFVNTSGASSSLSLSQCQ